MSEMIDRNLPYQVIESKDGKKFMCPECGTWGIATDAQLIGNEEFNCPSTHCNFSGKHDILSAIEEAIIDSNEKSSIESKEKEAPEELSKSF